MLAHSCYSYNYGTLSPKEILDEADANHIEQLVLADINSTSGSLYYAMEAQKRGRKVVLGVDFRTGSKQHFVAIARNNQGFQNINDLLSEILAKKRQLETQAPQLDEAYIVYPAGNAPEKLRESEYIGVCHTELISFQRQKRKAYPTDKCLAFNFASFRNKRDFNTHRLLRAIGNNTLLSKLMPSEQGKPEDKFYSDQTLKDLYYGQEYLLDNWNKLLDNCSLCFGFSGKSQNLKTYSSTKHEDFLRLKQLANEGLAYRFPKGANREVMQRLEKELEVISNCNFVPYFLVNHNIVSYARSKGYFYVGRGSGSNSLVAYLLRITNVDPIELDLYFERFINPSRKSPPDFDIDFSWRDREDVTRHIFETFPNTALLGSFVTFQQRSVIREIGKVLGLPSEEIKAIQQSRNSHELDNLSKLCFKYSTFIHGLPSHLSIHSSGIIITENPIHYFSATSLPPKGFPTTHFDMHIAEDVGINKYDILGQRGLGKIKDAISVIRENQPEALDFDIDDVARFKEDDRVKALLKEGDSIGCFYVESPAMRGLMKKLEVDDYRGLVAASSIIRPGVSHSGMMQEYIKRHRSVASRASTHPVLGEILQETYGVMVYQEDVLRVAHYFAKLTLEESDILRRGMSWKYRERTEFSEIRQRFFNNCKAEGYSQQLTSEVWKQIESFANYAFAKGHSASYAVESYQSLFLKAYFPLEYMVATINNGGGFYRTEQYFQEARLKGATIEPPCVNRGFGITTINGKIIFIGFQHIKELETNVIRKLLKERKNGTYQSLENFVYRTGISLEMVVILIRVGAFRSTGKTKSWLLWKAHFLLGKKQKAVSYSSLFKEYEPVKNVDIPVLEPWDYEDAMDEMEYLGFPLCSPFSLIDEPYLRYTLTSKDFQKFVGKQVTILGYLVHTKRTSTRGKQELAMAFGTFMDRDGRFFDSVHFPKIYDKFRFRGKGCYLLKGKVTSHYDYLSLEAVFMQRLEYRKLVKK